MGKTEKTQGRRGFVSRHGASVIFPPKLWASKGAFYSCKTPLLQLSPQQYVQKCKGSAKGAKKKKRRGTFQGRDSTRFKLRCAQASLYPCTLLYLRSLHWQKLWVHWAKAILVNSLPFMRRAIPRLFQLTSAWACRDDQRSFSLLFFSLRRTSLLTADFFFLYHWSDPLCFPAPLFLLTDNQMRLIRECLWLLVEFFRLCCCH